MWLFKWEILRKPLSILSGFLVISKNILCGRFAHPASRKFATVEQDALQGRPLGWLPPLPSHGSVGAVASAPRDRGRGTSLRSRSSCR